MARCISSFQSFENNILPTRQSVLLRGVCNHSLSVFLFRMSSSSQLRSVTHLCVLLSAWPCSTLSLISAAWWWRIPSGAWGRDCRLPALPAVWLLGMGSEESEHLYSVWREQMVWTCTANSKEPLQLHPRGTLPSGQQ